MKGFFSLFTKSAASLKQLRTLATTGILLAMAIVIRTLGIQVTPDLRIVFTFLPICMIAMLYGPVVCGISTFALDLIGYIIDNRTARAYSPQLAAVVILSGVIYGIFLYRDKFSPALAAAARVTVVLVCNICLNSYFIYSLYVNKNFSIFSAGASDWSTFYTYLWTSFRLPKNLLQLPVDMILLVLVLPVAELAYKRVRKQFVAARQN